MRATPGGTPRAMRCNTPNMNSWHSWSPNGKWLVFSSKARGIYTQLWLTHVDDQGNDTPAVLLENLMSSERAANIPEFIATEPGFLHKLVDGFSDGGNYHYRVAKTMIHYNDLDAAAERLELAIAREPNDPNVWLERGAVLFKLGRQQASFDSFRRAIELAPKDYRGFYNLGISQLGSNLLPEAVDSFSQAVQLSPKVPQIWYQRALARSKQADLKGALNDIREAIKLDAKSKELYSLAADLEQRSGDPAGAVADLDRAIELDPDYGTAWLNRSYAKLTLGDTADAEQDWIAGAKLAPSDSLVNMIKASLAFARGDSATGCQTLREAKAHGDPRSHNDEIDRALASRCQ
jgi:Flp pilus assembly protein TadD